MLHYALAKGLMWSGAAAGNPGAAEEGRYGGSAASGVSSTRYRGYAGGTQERGIRNVTDSQWINEKVRRKGGGGSPQL